MSKRMEVNKEGRHYTVQDGAETLGPFHSLSAALKEVVARGGRVHLTWARTVVGGETVPFDFTATLHGEEAGRIYIMDSGFSKGHWKAFPGGHNRENGRMGGGAMITDTKDEAVEFIERTFTELMAGVEPKPAVNAYAKAKGS